MGAPSTPCIFCDIAAHRAEAHIVYEDETTMAFLDIFPFTDGHTLVIPKRHVDRLTDLQESEYQPMLRTLSTICRRVERLSSDYNIGVNQGPFAGQIVFHLHFHLIPRYGPGNPFLERGRVRLDESAAVGIRQKLASG